MNKFLLFLLLSSCSFVPYNGKENSAKRPDDRWLAVNFIRMRLLDRSLAKGFGLDGFSNENYNCPYSLNPEPKQINYMDSDYYLELSCVDKKILKVRQNVDLNDLWKPPYWIASAVHSLGSFPRDPEEEKKFEVLAEEYRKKGDKLLANEEVRAYKIAAENAVKEKRFDDAIIQYRKGLTKVPTWPEARFNLALIYASKDIFDAAVDEMKKYLVLVPEAKNARQAKDKIYEWQAKVE